MLSEEALATADLSGNRSQYIEDLITGTPIGTTPQVQQEGSQAITLKQMYDLLEQFAKDHLDGLSSNGRTTGFEPVNLGSSPSEPAKDFEQFLVDYSVKGVVKPPHPVYGYPCCHNESPCKHWAYNDLDGNWVNSLTKQTKEV